MSPNVAAVMAMTMTCGGEPDDKPTPDACTQTVCGYTGVLSIPLAADSEALAGFKARVCWNSDCVESDVPAFEPPQSYGPVTRGNGWGMFVTTLDDGTLRADATVQVSDAAARRDDVFTFTLLRADDSVIDNRTFVVREVTEFRTCDGELCRAVSF